MTLCLYKHHSTKTYGESGTAPCILNLSIRWRGVVSFTPRPLQLWRNSPRYPLDRRLGEPQRRTGGGGEEKNIPLLPLPGIESRSPAHSLVTILTEIIN